MTENKKCYNDYLKRAGVTLHACDYCGEYFCPACLEGDLCRKCDNAFACGDLCNTEYCNHCDNGDTEMSACIVANRRQNTQHKHYERNR